MCERRELVVGEALFQVSGNLMEAAENPVVVIIEEVGVDTTDNCLEARVV